MSAPKHTKGPWVAHGAQGTSNVNGPISPTRVAKFWPGPGAYEVVADCSHAATGSADAEANAARIVACVNACEGYRPEMVREAIEMLQSIVRTCPETLRALRIDAAKTVAMLEEK